MAKKSVCSWCLAIVSVPNNFDEKKHSAVCSPACKAGEMVFRYWMSDEEVNKRNHYRELTKGNDDD
jgi:hypothetical protein